MTLVIVLLRLVKRDIFALYSPGSSPSLGVGRPRIGDLAEDEDGEGAVEVEAELDVEAEVDIKDKVSEGESVGAASLNAFWKSAKAWVTMSRPSLVTFILTPDALMMSERRVPASLLILKAQP